MEVILVIEVQFCFPQGPNSNVDVKEMIDEKQTERHIMIHRPLRPPSINETISKNENYETMI